MTSLERRLREFVDRRDEMRAFDKLLKRDRPERIAVVWGDAYSGKSSLLQRMMKTAEETATEGRSLQSVYVDWRGATSWDYLGLMREIRRQLGESHFPAFTSHVNLHFSRDPQHVTIDINTPAINILKDAQIHGSVGPVTGLQVDLGLVVPRGDIAIDEVDRVRQLTAAFLQDLAIVADTQTIIFFLDTFENASTNTIQWLWQYVLGPVRDGAIGNLLFIVCGKNSPPDYEDWRRDILALKLPPLGKDDIDEYLERRGLCNAEMRAPVVALLLRRTKGQAGEVAAWVDAMLSDMETTGSP